MALFSKQLAFHVRQNSLYSASCSMLRMASKSASPILQPLKSRDFGFVLSGQMISMIGDMFFMVTMPSLLLSRGNSPQELGIVLAAYGIPRVGTLPLGGMLSDRLRPRRIMLIADSMCAFLVTLFAVMIASGHPPLWQLCVVVMPLGAFVGLFIPASFAIIPEILPPATVQAGNALNAASLQLATLSGASAAGLIVAHFRPEVALSIDALSFVMSATAMSLTHRQRTQQGALPVGPLAPDSGGEATIQETKALLDGETHTGETMVTFWTLLRRWRLLQIGLIIVIVGNLTSGGMLEVALPVLVHSAFRADYSVYGWMLAAFGIGALAGGIGAGLLGHIRRRARIALWMMLVQGVMFVILPFAGGMHGALLSLTLAGFASGMLEVLFITLVQQQAPPHLLGRIMGAFMLAVFGFYPISVALGGWVIEHFGATILFPIGGLAMAAATLFGLVQTSLADL